MDPAAGALPSPAATLVLLRDRPAGGLETLLIQRHSKSKFAAGDYVAGPYPATLEGAVRSGEDAAAALGRTR